MSMTARPHMRLKDEFRRAFHWGSEEFTRDGFARWARTIRVPPIRVDLQHRWRPFREGEPVPREMVEAFSEYISDALKLGKYPLRAIADPADAPSPDAAAHQALPDIWVRGWTGAFAFFARNQSLPEEAYCRDTADIEAATLMILQCFGEANSRSVTGESAIVYAERVLARSRSEYADQLSRYWRANEDSVLFATMTERGEIRRVGVVVSVPITEGFYYRLRSGKCEDMDAGDGDVLSESLYIHINALAENKETDIRRAKAARSVAMVRTGMAQFASLAPPLYKKDADLRLISLGGTPENRSRMKAYNFRDVGTILPRSRLPVTEFAPPDSEALGIAYPMAFAEYLAMKAVVILFQAVQAAQRRLIDS